MFKFELGQIVYYLLDNKIHSAPILSRLKVENLHEGWDATNEQKEAFKLFGDSRTLYSTIHCILSENELFVCKEELAQSIIKTA